MTMMITETGVHTVRLLKAAFMAWFNASLDRRMLGHTEKFQSLDHFVDQDGAIAQWYYIIPTFSVVYQYRRVLYGGVLYQGGVRWASPFVSCLDRHSEKFQSLDHFVDQDGAIAQWYYIIAVPCCTYRVLYGGVLYQGGR